MKMYWYWPHPHRTTSAAVLSMLRPGDELTMHALASLDGENFGPIEEYEVVRTLPDPTAIGRSVRLGLLGPARLAIGRSAARRNVLKRDFDLVYLGMLFHHTDWAEVGRIRRRFPLAAQVHDVLPHKYRVPQRMEHAALKKLYRTTGHLIVFHDVLKDQLISEFGIEPDLVHVMPIPFDARDLRDRDLTLSRRPVLLYFGRFRPNKGVDVLVRALELLGDDLDADVVIAGQADPSTAAEIERRVGRLAHVSLELNRISAERKHQLMSQATWMVLPYTSFHSQSAMIGEAYGYRLPLIVSDVGALGPTVRDDATGIVVPPGDAERLAEALTKASTEPTVELQRTIGRVAQRHDYSVTYPTLRSIFDEVTADQTRPRT